MLSTIRRRKSSAKVERVVLNALPDAAGLIFAPWTIRLGIVFAEADPPFNFLKQQLSIRNRETR
jgi:hypothetical protein